MSEKTISVDVPEGFEFVQEGNVCFFRRLSKDFSVWKSKYSPVMGYFVKERQAPIGSNIENIRAIYKLTINTILNLFFSPFRLPLSINISKLL
jgi:hypothetical protein